MTLAADAPANATSAAAATAGLDPAADIPAGTRLTLCLQLHPEDAPALLRRLGKGRPSQQVLGILWHDTPAGDLAAHGLALAERRAGRTTGWLLRRALPAAEAISPAGLPDALLAEAATLDLLVLAAPEGPALNLTDLLPVAGFEGRLRRQPVTVGGAATEIAATLLDGSLRGATATCRACRLTLEGPAEPTLALALDLAAELRLTVPARSLAAEAYAAAGRPMPPRRLGAPILPEGLDVGGACAFVCAHLADVIQHHAPDAAGRNGSEPVHQMRVAMRRLRSALALFGDALPCPELEAIRTELGMLAGRLGPARDWDVFTAGAGHRAAEAFPGEPSAAKLQSAALRRRDAAYDALRSHLDGPEFRRMGISLAALAAIRPWQSPAGADMPTPDMPKGENTLAQAKLEHFAAHALSRRLRRVLAAGKGLDGLDTEALHALRLRAKRLRYACEIFAPLFPHHEAARYQRRVATLQDRLGRLNDGSVAATLMRELGRLGLGFAGGIIRGMAASDSRETRAEITRAWRRFKRTDPFWR